MVWARPTADRQQWTGDPHFVRFREASLGLSLALTHPAVVITWRMREGRWRAYYGRTTSGFSELERKMEESTECFMYIKISEWDGAEARIVVVYQHLRSRGGLALENGRSAKQTLCALRCARPSDGTPKWWGLSHEKTRSPKVGLSTALTPNSQSIRQHALLRQLNAPTTSFFRR